MKQSDILKGYFYVGGKGHRIREVLHNNGWSVDWRDADPESVDYNWLAQKNGSCEPRVFASWAKRKVEPEEVQERLAIPKGDRIAMSALIPTVDIIPYWREHSRKPRPRDKGWWRFLLCTDVTNTDKDHTFAPDQAMTYKAARDAAVELAARRRVSLIKLLP
jgi:hypothetical protein